MLSPKWDISYPSVKVNDHRGRGGGHVVRAWAVDFCSDTVCHWHYWTWQGCYTYRTLSSAAVTACTRPGQDQSQHGKERGSWSPTLNWGTTGNYWLLGEGNSVFFMNVAPKRQPCSRRLSYTQADIGSTKWTPVFKKMEHVSLWYIWSHNIWAFKWLSDFWNTLKLAIIMKLCI